VDFRGVGYGICERLLVQLSQPYPPDMMPQTQVDPLFLLSSLNLSPTVSPFNSLTIVLACRNKSRAIEARHKLLVFLDSELQKRRLRTRGVEGSEFLHAYAEEFRRNLQLDFIPCDLASTSSVLQFCETVGQRCAIPGFFFVSLALVARPRTSTLNGLHRYPYITHIFCNAGVGAFEGVDWAKAICQILRNPIEAMTYPCYKIQRKGQLSEDGLGWVWQCNVLGHYLMVGTISPLTLICARN
jgi:3-keto steroid reductase